METLNRLLMFLTWMIASVVVLVFCGTILFVVGVSVFGGSLSDEALTTLDIKTERAVAVAKLEGEILTSDKIVLKLERLVANEKIKAVVLQIDSPGGAVGASEEIFRAIKPLDKKKPIVCALSNLAASGGLYASMGCRKVVSNESTITGSIGVILQLPNVSSIADKAGFQMRVIKSGQFKDSGSPFRELAEEERQLMQDLVSRSYEQFVKVVSESRGLKVEDVKKFADGRIFLGEDSVKFGLVDQIGGIPQAAEIALKLANIAGEPEIVYPKSPSSLFDAMGDISESRVFSFFKTAGSFRLLYRLD